MTTTSMTTIMTNLTTSTSLSTTQTSSTMPATTTPMNVVVESGQSVSGAFFGGNLTLNPGATLVAMAGVTTTVAGTLRVVSSDSRRRMQNETTLIIANVDQSSTVLAVSASSIDGTFSNVVANTSDPCQSVQIDSTAATGTTISAVLSVSGSPCGTGGLSTKVIVGIAVGAAVGGILIILLVVLLTMQLRNRRGRKINSEIKSQELSRLNSSYQKR